MFKNYVFLSILVLSVFGAFTQFSIKSEPESLQMDELEKNLQGLKYMLPAHSSVTFVNTTGDAAIPSQVCYFLVPVIVSPRVHPSSADTVLYIYPNDQQPGKDTLNFHAIWRNQYSRCSMALYTHNKTN